jgi:uncharacterized protein
MGTIRILDADGHILEDDAGISRHLPEPFRSAGPFAGFRLFPPLDHLHSQGPTHVPEGAFRPVDAAGWLEFLDEVGIESTVIYPTMGLAVGKLHNRDWARAVTRAYNDWLHDAYLRHSPRLRGMALLALVDPQAAVAELERAVGELGMVGAMLPSNGLRRQLGARAFWPVYEAAQRLGCALAVHGGCHDGLGLDDADPFACTRALGHPLSVTAQFGNMLFAGVFDRFPGLRVAYLEAGVAWLLMAIERLQEGYRSHVPYDPEGSYLRLRGGEDVEAYIARQVHEGRIYVGCEGDERFLPAAIAAVGPQAFVFSSDFPHETNAARCRREIAEIGANAALTDAARAALLHANTERLYARTPRP